MKKERLFVCFDGSHLDRAFTLDTYTHVIAPKQFEHMLSCDVRKFTPLESLTDPGSIYEATSFLESLTHIPLPSGVPVSQSVVYKEHELWWFHYTTLFLQSALPHTQYRRLLDLCKEYTHVTLYRPPFEHLFRFHGRAYGYELNIHSRTPSALRATPGMLLQLMITIMSLLPLCVVRKPILVFTGDKCDAGKDYDARMKYVYEELRRERLLFVECVRSLEPMKTIWKHFCIRRRPVLYAEAIVYAARCISWCMRSNKKFFTPVAVTSYPLPEDRFKVLIATQHLTLAGDSIWAIRLMYGVLRTIGIRVAYISAALDRNFHTVVAAKIAGIPTVGILHGVSSRFYNVYDFTPGARGSKRFALDTYGVWSDWWKEYYEKYSNAYTKDQLVVSGPMRPVSLQTVNTIHTESANSSIIHVLLVSEVVAVPEEVIPYIDALLRQHDMLLYIKFRQHNDVFERWLREYRPDVLAHIGERAQKGSMQEAIAQCDVVIGSQSTGVIEATLQDKPFVFFATKKWGDYYDMERFNGMHTFFAKNPETLIVAIKEGRHVPKEFLRDIRSKFFGDPTQNGSTWLVHELKRVLDTRR